MADGEGFEPPEALRLQRFSRPSHSTALPPILNFFSTDLSNRRGFGLRETLFRSTSLRSQDRRIRPRLSLTLRLWHFIYSYTKCQILFNSFSQLSALLFFKEYHRTPAPRMNIPADNNCPIVSPQDVKKPICASG